MRSLQLAIVAVAILFILIFVKHSAIASRSPTQLHEQQQQRAVISEAGSVESGSQRKASGPTVHELRPGEFLLADAILATHDGRHRKQLIRSRLCDVAHSSVCWGEVISPPAGASNSPSFLAHQTDRNLCLYWGTPSDNRGAAWCEGLQTCAVPTAMVVQLDETGRLVGMCGAKRVWPSIWPMPALLTAEAAPSRLRFHGVAHKGVNGPILSTQRTLHNRQPVEYRVRSFTWHLDYAGLKEGERVESDICLTIFDSIKETSLESGEELLCTHEQVLPLSTAEHL